MTLERLINDITPYLGNEALTIYMRKKFEDRLKEELTDPDSLFDIITFSIGAEMKQGKKYDKKEYAGIVKFQRDRELHLKPYTKAVEVISIFEEMLESDRMESKEARVLATEVWNEALINNYLAEQPNFKKIIKTARNLINEMEYNVSCVLEEGAAEINSREGTMIEGKFIKSKTPEAIAKWYKADYSKCEKLITE